MKLDDYNKTSEQNETAMKSLVSLAKLYQKSI